MQFGPAIVRGFFVVACAHINYMSQRTANGYQGVAQKKHHNEALHFIRGRCHLATMPCPVGMEKFAAWFIDTFISMCTKIVALRL